MRIRKRKFGKLGIRQLAEGVIGVLIIFNFQFSIFNFTAFAQSGIKFGTFTPAPTKSAAEPSIGGGRPSPTSTPRVSQAPEEEGAPIIACLAKYNPMGGNNLRAKAQVYALLFKKYEEGFTTASLEEKFKRADGDIIRMAVTNYRLFGQYPDTGDVSQIENLIKSDDGGRSGAINYVFMKAYVRFLGILGLSLSEVEAELGALDCEARIQQVRRRSSSPLRVFTDKPKDMRVKIENRIIKNIANIGDTGGVWEFRAYPSGELRIENGELVKEIPFDYELFGDYRPHKGILVRGEIRESGKIRRMIKSLNLGFIEEEIVDLISKKAPGANYYFVSIFPREEADKALRWEITPKPDYEHKYIFYIKPLVEPMPIYEWDTNFANDANNEILESVIDGLRFKKERLAVLDYNVFVDY